MITGWPLAISLAVLCAWLLLLTAVLRKDLIRRTERAGLWGIAFATTAVTALSLLHLSWLSPRISQALGTNAVRILGAAIFWPAFAGLVASAFGSGRRRVIGVGSCLVVGAWYLTLSVGAAISMGAILSRHPVRYLIPDGYRGWIAISFGEHAPPLPMVNGEYICKVPKSGILPTSSLLEDGRASDHYFYYSDSGLQRELKETGWGGGGYIWAGQIEREGSGDSAQVREKFFVGTEDQYHGGDNQSTPK